jgi:hypothetical protein
MSLLRFTATWRVGPTCCSGRAQTRQKTIAMWPDETKDETKTSNAGAPPCGGASVSPCQLAVAAGFEPAEGCPSRAFEARSLGRSDTPPPERLPRCCGRATRFHDRGLLTGVSRGQTRTIFVKEASAASEEVLQQSATIGLEHAAAYLDAMVQARVPHDVEE